MVSGRLKTPRADAIAGIRLFDPADLRPFAVPAFGTGKSAGGRGWLRTRSNSVALALELVPFVGIAFLWFMGLLRDRLGKHEDRFSPPFFSVAVFCLLACCLFQPR